MLLLDHPPRPSVLQGCVLGDVFFACLTSDGHPVSFLGLEPGTSGMQSAAALLRLAGKMISKALDVLQEAAGRAGG